MSPAKEKEDLELEEDEGDEEEIENLGEGSRGSTSSQVRKAQNRIAQREFRLRKQQYIRDLEARVEVLSADKEERIELMTLLVRNLLKENKQLRGLARSMAGFIGEGLGSCLPRLGLSAAGLDAVLNRSDTDTAYEAFVNLKASKELAEANPGLSYNVTRTRSTSNKRKRDNVEEESGGVQSTDKGKGKATTGMSKTNSEGATPIVSEPNLPSSFYLQAGEGEDYHYLFPDLETFLSGDNSATSSRPVGPAFRPSPQPPLPSREGESFDPTSFPGAAGMPPDNGRQHGYASNIMPSEMGGMGSPKSHGQPLPLPLASTSSNIGEPSFQSDNLGYYGFTKSPEKADSSGFGVSIPNPPLPSSNPLQGSNPTGGTSRIAENSMDSLAGPRQTMSESHTQGNYATGHPSILQSDPRHSNSERQQTIREAVSTITNADNPLGGPGITAAELAERRRQQDQLMKIIEEGDPADRKMETMQLITYHLNNFRINPEYHLPPSLRPTVVQRTIPHEHAIDGIIFPSIRDRMILLRGRYDLVEVFRTMMTEFELHGEDALDHNNYEVSERFIENYSILVDDIVINISNKWRAQRGLSLMALPEHGANRDIRAGNRIHALYSDSYIDNNINPATTQ